MSSTILNINGKKQVSQTQKVALTGVMAALIAVATILAIPVPPPISTINLAPIIIFTVAILLGSVVGATATVIGCGIGYLAGTSLGTIYYPPGLLYIYLVGLLAARGPMAFIVGALRKKSEAGGMVVGVFVEFVVFFSIDFAIAGIGYAVFDFGTFIDLIFVPITTAVLLGVRRFLGTKYLS